MSFQSFLQPKSIAVYGGGDSEIVVSELLKFGYQGKIWVVNPTRSFLGGIPCVKSTRDLPGVPQLAFIGVSNEKTIEIIEKLALLGCKSAVCFAAGFADLGKEGKTLQQALLRNKGSMSILGPNCYGFINAIDGVAVWPYLHGCKKVKSGPALISQSGMLATTLTNNRRSVKFSFVVSIGNQAELGTEEVIEELLHMDGVTGFVVYQEAFKSIEKLLITAQLAEEVGKPVIMLKTGLSKASNLMCQNHTGATPSTIEVSNDVLVEAGIILVDSCSQLLESSKLLNQTHQIHGLNAIAFTCSGGDAAYLAECGERVGIQFPEPFVEVCTSVTKILPKIATLSNPLDCTTQLWGKPEILDVFSGMMGGDFNFAIFVQDYPHPDAAFDFTTDFAEMLAFANAAQQEDLPAFLCSSLGESLPENVRDYAYSIGIIPLQGIPEACVAIAGAYRNVQC